MKIARAPVPLALCGLFFVFAARVGYSSTTVTLVAAPQVLDFGGIAAPGMTYNGNYSGPLLQVKPGNTLRVHLVNQLPRVTNLHFHGILASPSGRSDNMMIHVSPGQSFDYEIKIPPYQTPGLYWYHAHVHGQAENDVHAGLSGPLLVEGLAARIASPAPLPERVLVLKEYEIDRENRRKAPNLSHGNILTLDGRINTVLNLQAGERQLWHVGNQGANKAFQLRIAGHPFTIVGHDGVPLLHPVIVDALDVDPASRYAVVIDAGRAGDYSIRGADDDGDGRGGTRDGRRRPRGSDSDDSVVLGTLHVSSPPVAATAVPSTVTSSSEGLPQDLVGAHIDAHRLMVFGERADKYTINGSSFDPMRVDTRVPLGNIEEWTIRNDTNNVHVFHIHQVTFQVMNINGAPQFFNGDVDTVRVLPRDFVVIRIAFTHPEIVGRFMYHCHILDHEDRGMMAQIEIYDPRKPNAVSTPISSSMSAHPSSGL